MTPIRCMNGIPALARLRRTGKADSRRPERRNKLSPPLRRRTRTASAITGFAYRKDEPRWDYYF